MQVTIEDLSGVKKKLHIEIPETEVNRKLDKAYNKLKKTAKVKGFRPGKIPRSVLERLFKKDVHADVASTLIQETLFEAVKDNELAIVGTPRVEPSEITPASPFTYDAFVEVKPELPEIDFRGMELEKKLYRISEEEISAQIKMIQKNLAQLKPIEEERPIEEGDFALIDYEGFFNGRPFAETQKTENFSVKVGEGKILKEFDDGLIGMKPGETKTIRVNFPADYSNQELAGKGIDFEVTLNEIRQEILPDIDDNLAKDVGRYETIEELKNAIRENLEKGYAKRVEQEINEQIFSKILEKTEFEVPDALVDYELENIQEEARRSFEYRGQSMEELGLSPEIIAERYRDTAFKQVQRQLILAKLIEQERLEISEEELDKGFEELAVEFGQPKEFIRKFYSTNPEKIDHFKHALLEKKVLKLILENSRIKEVEPESGTTEETTPESRE